MSSRKLQLKLSSHQRAVVQALQTQRHVTVVAESRSGVSTLLRYLAAQAEASTLAPPDDTSKTTSAKDTKPPSLTRVTSTSSIKSTSSSSGVPMQRQSESPSPSTSKSKSKSSNPRPTVVALAATYREHWTNPTWYHIGVEHVSSAFQSKDVTQTASTSINHAFFHHVREHSSVLIILHADALSDVQLHTIHHSLTKLFPIQPKAPWGGHRIMLVYRAVRHMLKPAQTYNAAGCLWLPSVRTRGDAKAPRVCIQAYDHVISRVTSTRTQSLQHSPLPPGPIVQWCGTLPPVRTDADTAPEGVYTFPVVRHRMFARALQGGIDGMQVSFNLTGLAQCLDVFLNCNSEHRLRVGQAVVLTRNTPFSTRGRMGRIVSVPHDELHRTAILEALKAAMRDGHTTFTPWPNNRDGTPQGVYVQWDNALPEDVHECLGYSVWYTYPGCVDASEVPACHANPTGNAFDGPVAAVGMLPVAPLDTELQLPRDADTDSIELDSDDDSDAEEKKDKDQDQDQDQDRNQSRRPVLLSYVATRFMWPSMTILFQHVSDVTLSHLATLLAHTRFPTHCRIHIVHDSVPRPQLPADLQLEAATTSQAQHHDQQN